MRATKRPFCVAICAAFIAVLAAACGHSRGPDPVNEAEPGRVAGVDLQILIGPLERTREEIESDGRTEYGYLDVRNNLDRSISVDFDGASHYDLHLGDRRTERVKLPAGSYSMAVSAPGMKPAKGRVSLKNERVYTIEIYSQRAKE